MEKKTDLVCSKYEMCIDDLIFVLQEKFGIPEDKFAVEKANDKYWLITDAIWFGKLDIRIEIYYFVMGFCAGYWEASINKEMTKATQEQDGK